MFSQGENGQQQFTLILEHNLSNPMVILCIWTSLSFFIVKIEKMLTYQTRGIIICKNVCVIL